MSSIYFTLVVNLSSFFHDYRYRARIFVNEKVKTVEDLQKKITNLFGIDNFFLTSQNEFLPPSEDVRILRHNEIVWVNPSIVSQSVGNERENHGDFSIPSKHKKRKSNYLKNKEAIREKKVIQKHSLDISVEETYQSNKRKKLKNFVDLEKNDENLNTIKEISSENKPAKNAPKQQMLNEQDNELHVNVGTHFPNSIPYKKNVPLPTITDKYLKEKKINIVKIDYISKPNGQVSQNKEDVAVTEEVAVTEVSAPKNKTEVLITNFSNNEEITPTPTPLINKNTEVLINSETESFQFVENKSDDKNQQNLSPSVPTTKYFFLNTPLVNEKKEKAKAARKQKKENFFKLKKEVLMSPIINYEYKTFLNTDKDSAEIIKPVEENVDTNGIKETSSINNMDVIEMEVDNEKHKTGSTSTVDKNDILLSAFNKDSLSLPEAHSVVNKKEINKINDEPSSPIIVNNSFTVTYVDNDQMLDETKPISQSQMETEIKKKEITSSELNDQYRLHTFGKLSSIMLEDSLNNISSSLNNDLLETLESNLGISGIKPIRFTKSSSSGVGQLLESLRSNESSIFETNSPSSNLSEFITQRKKQRKRKFLKNKSKRNSEETTTVTTSSNNESPKTPKQHIKFSNDKNEDRHEVSCIITESQDESYSNRPYTKMSKNLPPHVHDVISFKMLKLSEDFTPEISPYITGRVIDFSEEKDLITFEIISGAEILVSPTRKMTIEENGQSIELSKIKDIFWADVLDPILVNPKLDEYFVDS